MASNGHAILPRNTKLSKPTPRTGLLSRYLHAAPALCPHPVEVSAELARRWRAVPASRREIRFRSQPPQKTSSPDRSRGSSSERAKPAQLATQPGSLRNTGRVQGWLPRCSRIAKRPFRLRAPRSTGEGSGYRRSGRLRPCRGCNPHSRALNWLATQRTPDSGPSRGSDPVSKRGRTRNRGTCRGGRSVVNRPGYCGGPGL